MDKPFKIHKPFINHSFFFSDVHFLTPKAPVELLLLVLQNDAAEPVSPGAQLRVWGSLGVNISWVVLCLTIVERCP